MASVQSQSFTPQPSTPVVEISWDDFAAGTAPSAQPSRWQQAVAQVGEQLCAKLRVEVLPERLRKALDLVRADAVTLHADGSASVQSGKQTYPLAPDCHCADAKHRSELCKHAVRRDNSSCIATK